MEENDTIAENETQEKERKKGRLSKLERRKKEEVGQRLSRDYRCLKKLLDTQNVIVPRSSTLSEDDTDYEVDEVGSTSTQPPLSENWMRCPPKYLSALQVWLKKDSHEPNKYQKFIQCANNPNWHPPWRPPSAPTGWALYKAQVDSLINELAEWMTQELETSEHQSTASLNAESLRQMFELDLHGYAARKIKVEPKELRSLNVTERPLRRQERLRAAIPFPKKMNTLNRVKELALGDIHQSFVKRHTHAFGRALPPDHPMRGRPDKTDDLYRWVKARFMHLSLANWSRVISGMNDTLIGCAFSKFVNNRNPPVPADIWPPKAAFNVCPAEGKPAPRVKRRRSRAASRANSLGSRVPHPAAAFSSLSLFPDYFLQRSDSMYD